MGRWVICDDCTPNQSWMKARLAFNVALFVVVLLVILAGVLFVATSAGGFPSLAAAG